MFDQFSDFPADLGKSLMYPKKLCASGLSTISRGGLARWLHASGQHCENSMKIEEADCRSEDPMKCLAYGEDEKFAVRKD